MDKFSFLNFEAMNYPVYLDNNATTRCDDRVAEAMLPYFTQHYGNAASTSHAYGWIAEEAVAAARENIAALIGATQQEIVFTSGATEGNNLAIKGVFEKYAAKGNHIITVCTEHKAVLDTCKHLEKLGAEVTYLNVNKEGLISLDDLQQAIQPATILIAVMYANNETGVLQPVKEIGAVAKKHGIIFFCDAVQAAGKIPVNVLDDNIDLLSVSAHKFYGPKGIGALYVRRRNPRVTLQPQIDGGGHERGNRSGTLNVPGIVGLGKAAQIAMAGMQTEAERLSGLRNHLQANLLQLGNVIVNGSTEHRMPHVCNVSFGGIKQDSLLSMLNKTLAVSSGSACTSAIMEPSYVLKALGVSDELAYNSVRFSLGRFTTEEDVETAIINIKKVIETLRCSV